MKMDSDGIEAGENAFLNIPTSRISKFYLVGEIGEPEKYVPWFEFIRTAPESDTIYLYINSVGGNLITAVQFMRVLAETKAHVIASVEGQCISAATIIFLSSKSWEISDHSIFMFHNYSNMHIGKGGELYDSVTHEREWSTKLWEDVFRGFLTESEIKDLVNNKDIWMKSEEVFARLQKKVALEAQEDKSEVVDTDELEEKLKIVNDLAT